MFINEQSISDDEILPMFSSLFRAVCVSERPIPSFPKIIWEWNELPTIDTETDLPKDGNANVSIKPRIAPTSFQIRLFSTTTDDEVPDSSDVEGEIRIGLELPDTATILSAIRSMLSETIASLESSFLCPQCRDSSELSMSENSIDLIDNDELCNQNR